MDVLCQCLSLLCLCAWDTSPSVFDSFGSKVSLSNGVVWWDKSRLLLFAPSSSTLVVSSGLCWMFPGFRPCSVSWVFSLLLRLPAWFRTALCCGVSFAPSFLCFPFARPSWLLSWLSSCDFSVLPCSSVGSFAGSFLHLEILLFVSLSIPHPCVLPRMVPLSFVLRPWLRPFPLCSSSVRPPCLLVSPLDTYFASSFYSFTFISSSCLCRHFVPGLSLPRVLCLSPFAVVPSCFSGCSSGCAPFVLCLCTSASLSRPLAIPSCPRSLFVSTHSPSRSFSLRTLSVSSSRSYFSGFLLCLLCVSSSFRFFFLFGVLLFFLLLSGSQYSRGCDFFYFTRRALLSSILVTTTLSLSSVFSFFSFRDLQFSFARGFCLGPVAAARSVRSLLGFAMGVLYTGRFNVFSF